MEATLRKLRMIQAALIGGLALLAYLMERIPRTTGTVKPAVLWVLVACAVYLTITIFSYRVRRLSPAREKLRLQPSDAAALKKWEVWSITSLVLCAPLGLYGIVLRQMGASFYQAAGFYVGAIVLLLLSTPRRP
jgi:hypothetical protein